LLENLLRSFHKSLRELSRKLKGVVMKAPLSGDGFSLELFVNLKGVVKKTSQEVFLKGWSPGTWVGCIANRS
jgi:hypothetical protein